MDNRIVIMAGGTGGHVFPALAVAQWFLDHGWQVSWLGTRAGLESKVVPENGIAIDWLTVAGVRGKGLMTKFMSLFKLFKACGQAYAILRRRKPNVVLGMGGFVAGPGGLMARLLNIPLIIHEQNRVPGTTNKLLARFADKVLEAFPDSFKPDVKALCTGNPLRKSFQILPDNRRKNKGEALHVLIIGGSQGAQALNETIPSALAKMGNIEVKHQTGAVMQAQVAQQYLDLGIKADVNAFIDDMVAAYSWANLIICRAGAMTISEVAAMNLPSVLIPLPNAIDDHQMANARYLADAGAAYILPQKDLNADNLAGVVEKVKGQLEVMALAAKQCARLDATQKVAEICIAGARQ
jgi:UDP-N-acetylglucosamine--N-acetylmuramyl-(pentapeptide) pyrophosphoryl-undecaprenol N-acetylglucosamine transferase